MSNNISQPILFQSTAGAIPVRNEKGEVSMQRVKVQRYISGKKPEYAQGISSGEDSDNEDFMEQRPERRMHVAPQIIVDTDTTQPQEENDEKEVDDPRLRRLRSIRVEPATRRHEHSPEIIDAEPEESETESIPETGVERQVAVAADSSEESEDELDEDEIERRRKMLKEKLAKREAEAEGLGREEEELGIPVQDVSESGEDDDGDDYTDSEEETGPRIKPVFVRASERMTVAEREKRAKEQKKQESDAKKEKDERRREAVKLVEDTIRAEQAASKLNEQKEGNINDICTDDENDELEYETWKLRELKRIKRDKDEREALEKEALEIERIRNLTEDERRLEQRINPKQVTNKSSKGKYKFLQKYYHRGAFYLDQEEEVLKQDFSGPTLEDHFDKSVLPKVMQVKKFGRSGRTKYTHLVEQDTTQFDSPWAGDAPRLHANSRQVFHKPSNKRKHSSL